MGDKVAYFAGASKFSTTFLSRWMPKRRVNSFYSLVNAWQACIQVSVCLACVSQRMCDLNPEEAAITESAWSLPVGSSHPVLPVAA